MDTCALCSPNLAPVLAESEHWRLVLNRNQRFLGACFWVLRRHLESITALTPAEWADLHPQIIRATQALTQHFAPDHFNYAFLQNQDRHVHLHIFPRYAHPRTFAGLSFADADYPSHYTVPAPAHHLPPAAFDLLAATLRYP